MTTAAIEEIRDRFGVRYMEATQYRDDCASQAIDDVGTLLAEVDRLNECLRGNEAAWARLVDERDQARAEARGLTREFRELRLEVGALRAELAMTTSANTIATVRLDHE